MKPSERIKELESKITSKCIGGEIAPYWLGSSLLTALVMYLDEEYEKLKKLSTQSVE